MLSSSFETPNAEAGLGRPKRPAEEASGGLPISKRTSFQPPRQRREVGERQQKLRRFSSFLTGRHRVAELPYDLGQPQLISISACSTALSPIAPLAIHAIFSSLMFLSMPQLFPCQLSKRTLLALRDSLAPPRRRSPLPCPFPSTRWTLRSLARSTSQQRSSSRRSCMRCT